MMEIGSESICHCNNKIRFNGKHWVHIKIKPRHPALPKHEHEEKEARLKIPVIIAQDEMDFNTQIHSDAGGFALEWNCPDCNEKMQWSPHGWWNMDCSCRSWDFQIKAIGTQLSKENE